MSHFEVLILGKFLLTFVLIESGRWRVICT